MAHFSYKARDAQGRPLRGVIEAASPGRLARATQMPTSMLESSTSDCRKFGQRSRALSASCEGPKIEMATMRTS